MQQLHYLSCNGLHLNRVFCSVGMAKYIRAQHSVGIVRVLRNLTDIDKTDDTEFRPSCSARSNRISIALDRSDAVEL